MDCVLAYFRGATNVARISAMILVTQLLDVSLHADIRVTGESNQRLEMPTLSRIVQVSSLIRAGNLAADPNRFFAHPKKVIGRQRYVMHSIKLSKWSWANGSIDDVEGACVPCGTGETVEGRRYGAERGAKSSVSYSEWDCRHKISYTKHVPKTFGVLLIRTRVFTPPNG